jgi:hypothetical protein
MRKIPLLVAATIALAACDSDSTGPSNKTTPPTLPPTTDSVYWSDANFTIGLSKPGTHLGRATCGFVVGQPGAVNILLNNASSGRNILLSNSRAHQVVGLGCREGYIGYVHDSEKFGLMDHTGSNPRLFATGHNGELQSMVFANGFMETGAPDYFKLWGMLNQSPLQGRGTRTFQGPVTASASSDTIRANCTATNCYMNYPSGWTQTLGNDFTRAKGSFRDISFCPSVPMAVTVSDSVTQLWVAGDSAHYSRGDWLLGSLMHAGQVISAECLIRDELNVLVKRSDGDYLLYWRMNLGGSKPTATLIAETKVTTGAQYAVSHNGQPAYYMNGVVYRFKIRQSGASNNVLLAEQAGDTRYSFTAYHGRTKIPGQIRIAQ